MIVAQVSAGSPADAAGLKNGDVITGLNGHTVENGGALQVDVVQMTPGTHVNLSILRNGSQNTVNVTLGEYKKDVQVAGSQGDTGSQSNGGKLGLAMSDLTPDVRQQLSIQDNVKGAAIAQVRTGSPAENAGLQPGDVVSSIKKVPNGKEVLLLVWSDGGASYRVVTPARVDPRFLNVCARPAP